MSDWADYTEAVRGLAGVPGLRDARRLGAADAEAAAVGRARDELEIALRHCDEWAQLASRALATAEAKLVAEHVLLPDPAAGPRQPDGSPEELADMVRQAERALDADLAALDAARRHAAQHAIEDARRAEERAERHRELLKYTAIAVMVALVVALIVVLT